MTNVEPSTPTTPSSFRVELSDRLRRLDSAAEIVAVATEMLGRRLGAARALYVEMDSSIDTFFIEQDWCAEGVPSVAGLTRRLGDFGPLGVVLLRNQVIVVEDVSRDPYASGHLEAYTAISVKSHIAVPLVKDGQLTAVLAVHDSRPRQWSATDIALTRETVELTWIAAESASLKSRLRRERNQSQEILNGMAEGFALIDADWMVLQVNALGAEMTGRSQAEVLGRSLWQSYPEVLGTEAAAMYERVRQTGQAETIETPFELPDGRPIWLEGRAYPLAQQRLAIFFCDITERHHAEAALRRNTALFSQIIEQAPGGVYVVDTQFRVMHMNAESRPFFASAEPLIGRDFDEALEIVWGPEIGPQIASVFRHTLATGDRYVSPRFSERRNDLGVEQAFEWETQRITLPDGQDGVVCYFQDVTARELAEAARRENEERLHRLAAELSDADWRKDVFLATLAHELRNPLAPMRNGLQIMKLAKNNSDAVEQVRAMMDRQLSQLVRLVDDLLDVSRITQGKVDLRVERIDLKTVLAAALEASRPAIETAGHELTVDVPDAPIFVDGDAARLAQAVSNLLNNSAKYTRRGGQIQMTVWREDSMAVVAVKDNGIGIPPAMLDRVFDMFTQVDRALEKTTGGLGIGLSLVKGLLEMHGGTVEVTSDGEGMGSEFVLRLPVTTSVGAGPERESVPSIGVVPSTPRRILVVDDNVDSADSLGRMLEILGNEVRTANDGEAGIEAAAQFRPDVVLMDIGMPKRNGYEAARRIRQHPSGAAMLLVALTGWGQEDDRTKSADAGFNHHLVKPVDVDALMKLLSGP